MFKKSKSRRYSLTATPKLGEWRIEYRTEPNQTNLNQTEPIRIAAELSMELG